MQEQIPCTTPLEPTAIAVLAFNRPGYFRRMMQSLKQCIGVENMTVFVFLDHSGMQDRMEHIAVKYGPANIQVIARRQNRGCGVNAIGARRRIFDREHFFRCIVLEDDVEVNPYFLTFMEQLYRWANQFSDVGMVQAWSPCWWSVAKKQEALANVIETTAHLQGYMLGCGTWERTKGLLEGYEQRFLSGHSYAARDHRRIRFWMAKQADILPKQNDTAMFPGPSRQAEYKAYYKSKPATGQDAVTNLSMWMAGLRRLAPVVNRMINIGEEGIQMHHKEWVAHGFPNVNNDVFPSDTLPIDFQARDHNNIPKLKKRR